MPVPLTFLRQRTALCLSLWLLVTSAGAQDRRNIETGQEIPAEGYADMPLVVTLSDGSWLCTLTTGPGEEGAPGQSIIATRSTDLGMSWSEPVHIAPRNATHGSENSWVVPLHVAGQGSPELGRVYAFYITNGDHITNVPGRDDLVEPRVDMLGWYVYRFSDDAGATWSNAFRIDIPVTWADRRNTFAGKVQMLWGVDEPVISEDRTLIAFTKIRRYLVGSTEGWLLASPNLATESDPAMHEWQLLPMGNEGPQSAWRGLRSETHFRATQSEHDLTALNEPNHFILTNRTDTGEISISRSTDAGDTWSEPEPMRYADGRPIRNPRANAKVWKAGDSRYLLWFHNHGGTTFMDRNPGWIAGGLERDGHILWSQPEIALYHTDPNVRISYPDLIEEGDRYWLTETDKDTARVHEIDRTLLEGLWAQLDEQAIPPLDVLTTPAVIDLSAGEGFSIALTLSSETLKSKQELVRVSDGESGLVLRVGEGPTLVVDVHAQGQSFTWSSDFIETAEYETHHAVVTFDGGPAIVTMIVDGKLHDGAGTRQFGWGRFPPEFPPITIGPSESDDIKVYARALRTSEAVEIYGAFRASLPKTSRTR